MKELKFLEDTHQYFLGEEELPSVSRIMEMISKLVYEDVNEYYLDLAKEKGHAVHFAIEMYNNTGYIEIEDKYKGYIDAYLLFREEYKDRLTILFSEKIVYHKKHKYAGTIDIGAMLDGKRISIDTKTSQKLNHVLTQMQLPAYKEAENSWLEKDFVEECYTLHLQKNGKYSFDKVEERFNMFLKLFDIYNYIKEKKYYQAFISKQNSHLEVIYQDKKETQIVNDSPYKQAILLIKY